MSGDRLRHMVSMKGRDVQTRNTGAALSPQVRLDWAKTKEHVQVEINKKLEEVQRDTTALYAHLGIDLGGNPPSAQEIAALDENLRQWVEDHRLRGAVVECNAYGEKEFASGTQIELIAGQYVRIVEGHIWLLLVKTRKLFEGDESNKSSYPDGIMDEAAKACKPAADYYGLPVEVITETLEGLRAKAARETTARANEPPRLKAAALAATPVSDGVEWPSETWERSPEKAFHKQGAIIEYLKRVWKPFIKSTGALVTREILAMRDKEAALALTKHLRYAELPNDIGILDTDALAKYSAKRPVLLRDVLMQIKI